MMRFRGLTAIFAFVCLCYGQEGSTVNNTEGPPYKGWTTLMYYTGTNLEYVCYASVPQPQFAWTVRAATLASIDDAANTGTVSTSTAHGLVVGNVVTISGASDNDLNGTFYVQTIGTATTFTITTANVTDDSYVNSELAVATTAARTSASIWAISKLRYDGASNLISKQWAAGGPGSKSICDNRAVTTGTTKVTYQ